MGDQFFLGDLTAAIQEADTAAGVEPTKRTFEIFGETFELAPLPSAAGILLHAKAAADGIDATDVEGVAANCRYIDSCFSESEGQRFWACLHRNRVGIPGYTALVRLLIEAYSGNPTRLSTGSAGTSETTSRGSKDGSSKKGRSKPTTLDSSAA